MAITQLDSDHVLPHNLKAQMVWNGPGGRYDEISRTIADAIDHAVERLQVRPGERILDLATGTGWASRLVAQRAPAVFVTGSDIADRMLDHARAAATAAGLTIDYRHADAELLPFEDARFDGVVSTFGVMFAGRPEVAAAELARVVRKGGRIVLATWKHDSNVANMFGVMKRFMPPPPQPAPPSPFEWGKPARLEALLGGAFALEIEEGTNQFRYGSGAQAWELWRDHYGPAKALAANLDDRGRQAFRDAMIEWHESFPSGLGFQQPRNYLITRGIRR
jgi:SAM-dependent methyltransferase